MSQAVSVAPSATTRRTTGLLRVAVLSKVPLMRAGLSGLLSDEIVSVSVADGPHLVSHVRGHDVVVYDLADAGERALDAAALLLAEGVPVVALASCGSSHLAEAVLAMGVADIVPMSIDADGLVAALERAAAGQTTTLEAYRRRQRDAARAGTRLTDREVCVLELIGAGMANHEIAERLFVSANTLKTYIRTAYRKIGVSRRPQAVLWAARHGLTVS
jgi:NarL family two-component system response regulator LiaR